MPSNIWYEYQTPQPERCFDCVRSILADQVCIKKHLAPRTLCRRCAAERNITAISYQEYEAFLAEHCPEVLVERKERIKAHLKREADAVPLKTLTNTLRHQYNLDRDAMSLLVKEVEAEGEGIVFIKSPRKEILEFATTKEQFDLVDLQHRFPGRSYNSLYAGVLELMKVGRLQKLPGKQANRDGRISVYRLVEESEQVTA